MATMIFDIISLIARIILFGEFVLGFYNLEVGNNAHLEPGDQDIHTIFFLLEIIAIFLMIFFVVRRKRTKSQANNATQKKETDYTTLAKRRKTSIIVAGVVGVLTCLLQKEVVFEGIFKGIIQSGHFDYYDAHGIADRFAELYELARNFLQKTSFVELACGIPSYYLLARSAKKQRHQAFVTHSSDLPISPQVVCPHCGTTNMNKARICSNCNALLQGENDAS